MRATREAGFGDEVKRRIILGTYALSSGYYDAYYGQAQKVRTLISRDFAAAFEQADVLVSPTAPTTAFKLGEKVDDPIAMYLNDLATIPANLSGVPGISVPSGLADEDGLPAGFQVLAPALADDRRYRVGAALEALLLDQWGGPLLDRAPSWRARHDRDPDAVGRGARALRPRPRARGARRAQHGDQDVLRLPGLFGGEPNSHVCPTCLGLPGRDAGRQRQGRRVGDPDRPRAQLRDRRVVPLRAEELLLPGHAEELPDLAVRRADRVRRLWTSTSRWRARPSGSRSSAPTWRRTPASPPTWAATGRIHGADYSLVDYNRAGIPLIEIVTKPILGAGEKAPEVARAYVSQLRDLIVALGVSEARMDQGNLRADVNLSLRPRARACSAPAPRPRT